MGLEVRGERSSERRGFCEGEEESATPRPILLTLGVAGVALLFGVSNKPDLRASPNRITH